MSNHHHHHHGGDQTDERALKRAFFLIAGFMGVELVVGLWANALVLIADAGHMFLDATALGLAWWAVKVSKKDTNHSLSYGYHRMQVLAAFVNGITLVLLIGWIVVEAGSRLWNPQPMQPGPALVVAVLGLLVNLIAFKWLHDGSDSLNMRSAVLHVLGDLLGSAAAIVAALCVLFLGWLYADPMLALLIAVILGRGAWRVLRESGHILLEGVPEGIDLKDIRQSLCQQIPGLADVHHVHAWALTAEKPLLTLHAQVHEESQIERVTFDIKKLLNERYGIDHSTIQVELQDCPDEHDH